MKKTYKTIAALLSLSYSLNIFAAGWVTQSPKLKCELFDEQEAMVWSTDQTVNLYRAGITPVNYVSPDESVKVDIKIEVIDKKFGSNDTYRLTEMKLSAGNMTARKENYGAGTKMLNAGLYDKLLLESTDGSIKYQLNCFTR